MQDYQAAAGVSGGFQCQGKLMEPGSRMIGDAAQHIGEPGLGIDAVEFCCGDLSATELAVNSDFSIESHSPRQEPVEP
jgi:hypothetical protein